MSSIPSVWGLPGALLSIATISMTWYRMVSKHVPDPYLDEFFHVPQAQRYCNSDFSWDPKITTPPGLYLVSLLLKSIIGCDTSNLRALNVGAICLICVVSYNLLRSLRKNQSSQEKKPDGKTDHLSNDQEDRLYLLDAHTALNISLFPPLFFFSALYYTDVMSTLVVLASYWIFTKRKDSASPFLINTALVIVGVISLFFRQTNIFWVAVFPAALAVVDALKEGQKPGQNDAETAIDESWNHGRLYDCPVETAGPQDFLLFFISVILVAVQKPALIIRSVIPYLMLINLFAWFVLWNGSVVLGDKSAHTATLHLPQMLYFWPYVVFFSIPLTIGPILSPIIRLLPNGPKSFLQNNITGISQSSLPSLFAATLCILSGLAAVHYNTIIHPYTLADNRHYVFYVFRILQRHPAIKYLAVPIYYLCAWMAFRTLELKPQSQDQTQIKQDSRDSIKPNPVAPSSHQSCQISFVIAWVATTTLSVATAPLVEPRYFIIPYIIWRLHVPCLSSSSSISGSGSRKTSYDLRLVLETLWLLTVNALLGYMFLYRGFEWPQEPGRVQRFLW